MALSSEDSLNNSNGIYRVDYQLTISSSEHHPLLVKCEEFKISSTVNENKTINIKVGKNWPATLMVDGDWPEKTIWLLSTYFNGENAPSNSWLKQNSLFINIMGGPAFVESFKTFVQQWSIYHFTPQTVREDSGKGFNHLMPNGQNLPSIIFWLKENEKKTWSDIQAALFSIWPALEKIDVIEDVVGNLTLVFKENKFDKYWSSRNVSDGTIIFLASLCAVSDSRATVVIIEEIENAFHPWMLRKFVEHCQTHTQGRQTILTTHSPVLIDMCRPDQIWCINKENGQSVLSKLTDLDPEIEPAWNEGNIILSEYLDGGLVPKAVPGGML